VRSTLAITGALTLNTALSDAREGDNVRTVTMDVSKITTAATSRHNQGYRREQRWFSPLRQRHQRRNERPYEDREFRGRDPAPT